jgi:hypothetical protein
MRSSFFNNAMSRPFLRGGIPSGNLWLGDFFDCSVKTELVKGFVGLRFVFQLAK